MDTQRHPFYNDLYNLMQEIEKLPPSEHATKLVCQARDLEKPVDRLVEALETIVTNFDELNGTECTNKCGKCIRCIAQAALR